jgi:translation initiation factor 4E
LIGEEFEEDKKEFAVLGAVLSIREKRNILEIWIRKGEDEQMRIGVGEKLREVLGLNPNNLTFYFKVHSKSLQVYYIKN